MKNLAFIVLLAAAPAYAQSPASRTLTMAGHGEVKAVPDQVEISAGVTASASNAAAALTANNSHMTAVFAALKKMGVPDRQIQTSNVSVSPQYTNGDSNGPRRLTGYQVNNQVSVRLDDVSRAGAVLDALVAAGANQMNGVSFAISKPEPLLKQARAQAVADARARAETYARAAGVTLGPILSISENEGGEIRPLRMAPMAFAAKAVPVAPGEESVTADVSIVWEIH